MDINLQAALISAGAALIGSIIGVLGALLGIWLNKKMQSSGKISLYARVVYSEGAINRPWGFYESSQGLGLFMQISVWIDIINTSGISRIVRYVNLYACNDGQIIKEFAQIQKTEDDNRVVHLGLDEAYTIVVEANCSKRVKMEFLLHERNMEVGKENFDEIILGYWDEKNKLYTFHFSQIKRCWVEGKLPMDRKWIKLDKRCRYKLNCSSEYSV